MERSLGIELGDFNCQVAVSIAGKPVMIESRYGKTLYGKQFPSFVSFGADGKVKYVGQKAKEDWVINPKQVVWGVKRLVGLSYASALKSGDVRRFQYDISESPDGGVLINVAGRSYTPTDILAFLFRVIKEDAENRSINPCFGGVPFHRAVITVPAYFKDTRVRPILKAAEDAGFTDLSTIAEPTAAAVAYGIHVQKEATLLAYYMGAGTLDVTVLHMSEVGGKLVPGEAATSGNETLGGLDIDDILYGYLIDEHGLNDVDADPKTRAMLRSEVERAKVRLSKRQSTVVESPDGQSLDLTRADLERLLGESTEPGSQSFLARSRAPIGVALRQAGVDAKELDHVLFVGGPVHMPCIRKAVREELAALGARPDVLAEIDQIELRGFPVDPMEYVAQGAALKAERLAEPVVARTPYGYGTVFPVAGHAPFFQALIAPNSILPVNGTISLLFLNPTLKRTAFRLVSKELDQTKSSVGNDVWFYKFLGQVPFELKPTGEHPIVDVNVCLDENRRLSLTLKHQQSGTSVTYDSLDKLDGSEVVAQETTPPALWSELQCGVPVGPITTSSRPEAAVPTERRE